MVRGLSHRARRSPLPGMLIAAAVLLTSCDSPLVAPPAADDAFVYIILGQGIPQPRERTFGQHAFLLKSESLVEPPTFLEAERFEMRRVADGALYAWESYGYVGVSTDVYALSYSDANYHLPDTLTSAGLGADSIRPGESYSLEIAYPGGLIAGSVTMPDTFSVSISRHNDQTVATWSARGAPGFRVRVPGHDPVLVSDTTHIVPPDASTSDEEIIVEALDQNLWRYLTDGQTARAGLTGAVGLFGGLTTATVRL